MQMAGILATARETHSNFQSNHFAYVIIDEGACCQVPLTLQCNHGSHCRLVFMFARTVAFSMILEPEKINFWKFHDENFVALLIHVQKN